MKAFRIGTEVRFQVCEDDDYQYGTIKERWIEHDFWLGKRYVYYTVVDTDGGDWTFESREFQVRKYKPFKLRLP